MCAVSNKLSALYLAILCVETLVVLDIYLYSESELTFSGYSLLAEYFMY